MRAEATMKNSVWGLFQQTVVCILSLFSRRVMLDTIGVEGVGLNGLLTNVVAVLSLADMGINASIIFHMYKPLATGDEETITRLMNFYRSVYRIIAVTILAIGLCLMPFMKYIVHDVSYSDGYVMLIYFLFLMQTVTSYIFSYKRSIISADQKQYIITMYDLVLKIVTVIIGIVILKLTNELSYYLIFLISAAFINDMLIAKKANTMYPYIKNHKLMLEKEDRKSIFQDVKNIFIGRISGTITNSTDNILISALVGTIATGLYSNYTIILNTLNSVMNQFSYAMIGSIGNLLATETGEHIEKVLEKLIFIIFFMAAFCCVCLSCLIDPFITLAFGDNLLLERYVVYIAIAVFYFATVKIPVWNMVQASGLFKTDKFIAIIGSVINLIVSFILGKVIGIAGILIGTICTYVIQYNLKVALLYKKYLHRKYGKILAKTYFYFILAAAECLLMGFLTSKLPIGNEFVKFIVSGICAVAFGIGFNCIIFRKRGEYIYFRDKMLSMVKNKIGKKS